MQNQHICFLGQKDALSMLFPGLDALEQQQRATHTDNLTTSVTDLPNAQLYIKYPSQLDYNWSKLSWSSYFKSYDYIVCCYNLDSDKQLILGPDGVFTRFISDAMKLNAQDFVNQRFHILLVTTRPQAEETKRQLLLSQKDLYTFNKQNQVTLLKLTEGLSTSTSSAFVTPPWTSQLEEFVTTTLQHRNPSLPREMQFDRMEFRYAIKKALSYLFIVISVALVAWLFKSQLEYLANEVYNFVARRKGADYVPYNVDSFRVYGKFLNLKTRTSNTTFDSETGILSFSDGKGSSLSITIPVLTQDILTTSFLFRVLQVPQEETFFTMKIQGRELSLKVIEGKDESRYLLKMVLAETNKLEATDIDFEFLVNRWYLVSICQHPSRVSIIANYHHAEIDVPSSVLLIENRERLCTVNFFAKSLPLQFQVRNVTLWERESISIQELLQPYAREWPSSVFDHSHRIKKVSHLQQALEHTFKALDKLQSECENLYEKRKAILRTVEKHSKFNDQIFETALKEQEKVEKEIERGENELKLLQSNKERIARGLSSEGVGQVEPRILSTSVQRFVTSVKNDQDATISNIIQEMILHRA